LTTLLLVVQFGKKRFVSGLRFSDAVQNKGISTGFSRRLWPGSSR
jgi:hypothetical protein